MQYSQLLADFSAVFFVVFCNVLHALAIIISDTSVHVG